MESYLRVNLLGPGPRLMKKNLPGRVLTKVEKHCYSPDAFRHVSNTRSRSDIAGRCLGFS